MPSAGRGRLRVEQESRRRVKRGLRKVTSGDGRDDRGLHGLHGWGRQRGIPAFHPSHPCNPRLKFFHAFSVVVSSCPWCEIVLTCWGEGQPRITRIARIRDKGSNSASFH